MNLKRRVLTLAGVLILMLAMILPAHGWEQVFKSLEADPVRAQSETAPQISVQAQAAALGQPSKAEIAAKWKQVTSSATIFATEPSAAAPYAAGSLTEEFLETGLTYLNYVRFVAGLPEVTLDDTLNEDAQHGAVVLAAIDQLTHYPTQPSDMDDTFYNRGYSATTSSNISARWGYSDLTNMLKSSLQGCMNDNNSLNNLTTAGHRRWLLNPVLGKVGFGYAESDTGWSYIVTKVFDKSGAGCSYDFISWPVAGNHPTNLFDFQNPWTVTLNPGVFQAPSAADVKVTITRAADGKQWSLDGTTGEPNIDAYSYIAPYLTVNNQGYGVRSCIIFHPGSEAVESYEGVYRVKITGLYYKDGAAAELNYEVDFFDINSVGCAHSYTAAVTAPTCKAQGYTTYTCAKCGDSYVGDYTDPVDHSYEDGFCIWCGEQYFLASGICGDNAQWVLTEDGTLIISGTGATYDYAYEGAPWFEYRERITSVVVEDGITRLGEYIFTSLDNLVSADLSDTITEIGRFVFWGDEKLSQAELPANLESLGQEAFARSALTSVEIPGSLTFLDACVFQYCTSLTDVVIHSGNVDSMTFGNSTFRGCTALENIYVDDDHFALFDMDGILYSYYNEGYELLQYPLGREDTVLEILDGTLIINMLAVEAANNLEEVIIPASLRDIYTFAFSGSDNLKTIRFLGDAPAIQTYAFNGVTATAYYPYGNETWTSGVMQNYGGEITWEPYGEPEEEYFTQWISATTSLNGTIDLNIYVALSDNILNDPDAFVRFIRNGVIVDVPVSEGVEAEKRGQICYRYSCEIFAKQVADTITIQVMNADGAISDVLEYSVMRYCVNQIKNSPDAELVKLCKALLNYATAAQIYFNHNPENPANASLSDADKVLPDVDASAYKFNVVGSEPGIKPRSATLNLESEVAIRVYFIVEEGYDISDFTFTIDGKEVVVQQNEKGYYIESDGIAAKELDDMHQFSVGGLTVNYGALSYVNSKAGGSNVNEANLAKALYAYYVAAEALLG